MHMFETCVTENLDSQMKPYPDDPSRPLLVQQDEFQDLRKFKDADTWNGAMQR